MTVISSCVYVTTAPTDDHNMRVDGRDLLLALGIIRSATRGQAVGSAAPSYRRPCRLRDPSPDDAGQTTGRRSRRAGRDEGGSRTLRRSAGGCTKRLGAAGTRGTMWKTASASPPSGGRPRLVADHTQKEKFPFSRSLGHPAGTGSPAPPRSGAGRCGCSRKRSFPSRSYVLKRHQAGRSRSAPR